MRDKKTKFRIDKWLWAVRVFKTRSMATDACNAGKVKLDGKSVKPARKVDIGEVFTIRKGPLTIVYKVEKIIQKRVSASLAAECFIDQSPPPPPRPTFGKKDSAFFEMPVRARGTGRPTKKERRELDYLTDIDLEDYDEDFEELETYNDDVNIDDTDVNK